MSARWAGGAGSAGKEATKAELMAEFEGGYISENELRDHLTALGYSGPALDLEVIELLRDDAQLLAIADAVAATQSPHGGRAAASGPRPLSHSGDQRHARGRGRPRPRKT